MNQPLAESANHSSNVNSCPIEKLNFDVLRYIFLLSIDPKPPRDLSLKPLLFSVGDQLKEVSHKVPILLSCVCRHWRQCALDIPTMWSTLNFERSGRVRGWAKQVTCLKRSKDAPLDIQIWSGKSRRLLLSISDAARILRMLRPHLHRWRSLEISLHFKGLRVICDQLSQASAPALETLILDPWEVGGKRLRWKCRIFSGGLPKLRTWQTNIALRHPLLIAPRLDNLRVLCLEDRLLDNIDIIPPTAEEIALILSRYPKLEELHFLLDKIHYSPQTSTPLPTIPVVLPHLTTFKVGNYYMNTFPYANAILRYIHAPNLLDFDTAFAGNSIIPVIALSNPFPQLKDIFLCQFPRTPDAEALPSFGLSVLENMFNNLSSLNSLTFYEQTLHADVFQALKRYCPHLTDLQLSSSTFVFSECVEMVRARMESTSVSSLRRLRLSYCGLKKEDTTWLQYNVPQLIVEN